MPVHQFIHDGHLSTKGLRNYWGYNSIGFLAPHNDYSRPGPPASRSRSSRDGAAMHEAGIEVILDVVYNHTAEGNHLGPDAVVRGIDNQAYYRLVDDDPATTSTSPAPATA
jgi:isoamylase